MWSATGGGHRASAEAIKAGIYQLYGNRYLVDSVDMWQEHMEWPLNKMAKSYNFLVKHSTLWKCIFNAPEELHHANLNLTAHVNERKLGKAFEYLKPDLVVSLHPAMQHVPLKVIEQRLKKKMMQRRPAFATVVTDLSEGCHHLWFHKDVDLCFVPIEEVRPMQQAPPLPCGLRFSQQDKHILGELCTFRKAWAPCILPAYMSACRSGRRP